MQLTIKLKAEKKEKSWAICPCADCAKQGKCGYYFGCGGQHYRQKGIKC